MDWYSHIAREHETGTWRNSRCLVWAPCMGRAIVRVPCLAFTLLPGREDRRQETCGLFERRFAMESSPFDESAAHACMKRQTVQSTKCQEGLHQRLRQGNRGMTYGRVSHSLTGMRVSVPVVPSDSLPLPLIVTMRPCAAMTPPGPPPVAGAVGRGGIPGAWPLPATGTDSGLAQPQRLPFPLPTKAAARLARFAPRWSNHDSPLRQWGRIGPGTEGPTPPRAPGCPSWR